MRWVSHIAIAAAPAAVFAPLTVPAVVLGATAPDWLEWLAAALGAPVEHRGPTHYALGWVLLCVFFAVVGDWQSMGLGFAFGGLAHVLCDALTVSGVPMAPWSDRRAHLFGGRLVTGSPAEYMIAGLVVMCSITIAAVVTKSGWYPFFFDWAGYYSDGLMDGSEWKVRRWQLI